MFQPMPSRLLLARVTGNSFRVRIEGMKRFDTFVLLSRDQISWIGVTLNVKVFFCSNKQVSACFPFLCGKWLFTLCADS